MSVVLMAHKNAITEIVIQLIVFIIIAIRDIRAYKNGRKLLPIGILLLAYGVFWIRYGANWIFIANLVLWALYTVSKRTMTVFVSKDCVSYPSFPKKLYTWDKLNNVILKDDWLTIDCKNNHIYQHFIQNSEQFAEEAVFNDFCRNQLRQ
ncbi:MAG: hypothetical protein ACK5NK_10710 [Niabella sp.]